MGGNVGEEGREDGWGGKVGEEGREDGEVGRWVRRGGRMVRRVGG
jgi:hypothetical protein